MIVFTRTGNSIEIAFDSTRKQYASPDAILKGDAGGTIVYITENLQAGTTTRGIEFTVTEITGRPSDDALDVVEWLRDTYFYGFDYTIATAPAGNSTVANQLIQIARADAMVAELNQLKSGMITVQFDEKTIVFTSAPEGIIDYVLYELDSVEVARQTFTYDAYGNIINIIAT